MNKRIYMIKLLNIICSSIIVSISIIIGLSFFRVLFIEIFSPHPLAYYSLSDMINTIFFGLRLDISLVCYLFSPILIFSFFLLFLLNDWNISIFKNLVKLYYIIVAVLLGLILFGDYMYYGFFDKRLDLFLFGIINDDTIALAKIAWKNYHVFVFLFIFLLLLIICIKILNIIFNINYCKHINITWKRILSIFFVLIITDFLLMRGGFGVFPIYHITKDISSERFLNIASQNSVFLLHKAYKYYKKSKKGQRNLVKEMGFDGHIIDAFKIINPRGDFNKTYPEFTLLKHTKVNKKIEKLHPNVIVIMVESFGTPILRYQSKNFDIMRHLKRHFDEDIVFNNFISAANGTIVSLEPTLLNLVARPSTTSYGQGLLQNFSFPTAAAKVYLENGYETSFIYGGDLSWRNVGGFMPLQGFMHVEGKAKIAKTLGLEDKKYFHDWGVYDQFLYKYILNKLQKSKEPQFIYVMTTNNHPPFELYQDYHPKKLFIDERLSKHLRGDRSYIMKRLYDYQYALDSLGRFLDAIKDSNLSENTVVAITADNNTIEGLMNYDNFYETSKKIPFYIYLPPKLRGEYSIDTTVPGSHKDLMPTLYNFTLSNTNYMAVGSNLLDQNITHCGINEAGIIISRTGAFMAGHPKDQVQRYCDEYRRAAIAVTDYLIKRWRQRNDSKSIK